MKRILFRMATLLVALVMVGVTSNVYCQEKGDMAAGVSLVGGKYVDTFNGVDIGLGVRFQYNVTDPIRLDGQFNYYFGEYAPLDFSVNAHYLINVMPKLNVYPLAGLSFIAFGGDGSGGECNNDGSFIHRVSDGWVGCVEFNQEYGGNCPNGRGGDAVIGGIGLNIGGGAEYQLTDKIFGTTEVKYNLDFGFALSAGVVYKF